MSPFEYQALERQRFLHPSDPPAQAVHARNVLHLLLAQDGSTTRLCEAIAGGAVSLHVLEQRVVDAVPAEVRAALPGSSFLERITSLAAHGQVMMDNLSYVALEGLPADVRRDLEGGVMPIGHLLSRLWVRRSFLDAVPVLYERLWGAVGGLPDAEASRTYCIVTPEGPRMLIAETYRRGMLMQRPAAKAQPEP
jgi:chorismate-pyruvate lyase